jgi:hypothetical protein
MTKISQHERTRPRHESSGTPPPADPARAASPARSPSHASSGPPSPLGGRRSPTMGGALAPRAALPSGGASASPSLRGLLGRPAAGTVANGAAASGVKLDQLPPVPRIRDTKGAWNTLWKAGPRREMFDGLRLKYQQHQGKDVSGAKFLEKVVELTGQPGAQAFTTARADVTRFVVKVPGSDEAVHLLRRDADDGLLGDIVRLDNGNDDTVAQALEGVGKRERSSLGKRARNELRQEAASTSAGAANAGGAGAGAPGAPGVLPEVPAKYFFLNKVKSKSRMKICEPVLTTYLAAGGRLMTMPGFLEMVFQHTATAKRLPTERPDIGHFLVTLPGFEDEPLNVLTRVRHDGKLADIAIAEPGDPESVVREIAAIANTARKLAGRGRIKEDGADPRVRNTLPSDLTDVLQAYRTLPGNLDIAEGTFHVQLCQWAEEASATARPTRYEGIERFTVQVPNHGPVELLGQRDEKGRVVGVQRLQTEAELEHKLQRMGRLAKASRSRNAARLTGESKRPKTEENKRLTNIWKTMQAQLQGGFQAWKAQRVGAKSGAGSFVAHLENLCAQAGGEVVVSDAEKTVTRHVISPNDGGPSVTLLRYTNAAEVATGMRVVDATLTEQDAIAVMSTFEKRSESSKRVVKSTAPQRVLADDLARPIERQVTTAKAMRLALAGMLANQRAGKPDLLAGLKHEDELRTWFQHDGTPVPGRTGGSFVHLSMFARNRAPLVNLLTQLGQKGLVEGLPPQVTAGLLAKVLKARAEHPQAGTDELMQVTGVTANVYHDYLNLSTGALHTDTRVRYLPGYDQHWGEIRDALTQLGHTKQATQLRGPSSDPAEQLVNAIENEMYSLQAALHAMRVQGLPRRQAARSAGLSNPAILRTLVDHQGQVRNLQFIASRLPRGTPREAGDTPSQPGDTRQPGDTTRPPGGTPPQAGAIQPQPGHASPARGDGAPAAPRPIDSSPLLGSRLAAAVQRLTELADRDLVVRATKGRGRKLFIVGLNATRPGGSAQAVGLRRLYGGNLELVRAPRSFESERPRQTLRWLSTALKRWFPGSIEIQAYHDPVKNEIWVASNVDEVNARLRAFLSSGGLMDTLADFDSRGTATRMRKDRDHRHLSKLKHALDDPSLLANDAARAALMAMAAGRFRVPMPHDAPDQGRRGLNLHAERRIRHAVLAETGQAPDPFKLTGTRRPCGICAKDLQLPPGARRGPIWQSASSRAGYDPAAVADDYAKAGIPTFITEARDGHWTVNHDTDSEAEPDLERPGSKRKAPARQEPPAKRHAIDDADGGGPITYKRRSHADRTQQAAPPRPAAPPSAAGLSQQAGPSQQAGRAQQAGPSPHAQQLGPSQQAAGAAQHLQVAALQEDALDAALLLHRHVDVPVQQEQVTPLLQGLLDEGSRRFDAFRAQLATQPDARATPEQRQEMRQLGELSLRLRRSAAALGWLPAQASPTAALPVFSPPADGNWERPMRDLFISGTASGARNICWFDTLAQLALDQSRDLGGDTQPVDELAAELRETADRMGLTEAGAMADDDHGALQLIAHSLGLQVHVFLRQPDGEVVLSPLQSVGAPGGNPVYVYSDDTHFEPLWPAWEQER